MTDKANSRVDSVLFSFGKILFGVTFISVLLTMVGGCLFVVCGQLFGLLCICDSLLESFGSSFSPARSLSSLFRVRTWLPIVWFMYVVISFVSVVFSLLGFIIAFVRDWRRRWRNIRGRRRVSRDKIGIFLCSCGLLVVFILIFCLLSDSVRYSFPAWYGVAVMVWLSGCGGVGYAFFEYLPDLLGIDLWRENNSLRESEQRKTADEWKRKEAQRQEEEERRRKKVEETERFLVSLFSMAAKMAKADGVADASEVRMAEQLFTLLNIQGPQREKLKNAFNAALLHPEGIYADADTVAAYVGQLEARAFFYELLWDIACADGVLASEEKEILIRICSHLKIPDFYFELNYLRRVSTFQEAHRHSRQTDEGSHVDGTASLTDAYATLGCHPEATDEEVRRAYRTSAKTYRPDVLRANNVPDEMIAVATRKMATLNEAWARIRRARGI